MMKTLAKITLPLILLFLSGCAHYGRHAGHYRHSSSGYSVDRHNTYRPHTGYYNTHNYGHERAIHIYDNYDRHHNTHNYHYDKHNDHNRHRGNNHRNNHNSHSRHNKKSKHQFEKHYVRKSSSKHGKSHNNSKAYRSKKHNKYDFYEDRSREFKHKKQTKYKNRKQYADQSLSNFRHRNERRSNHADTHKLARKQSRTWNSKGNRSGHDYYRH